MRKLRIFLVDDHTVLREGLTLLINSQQDMEVVGHADNGHEILKRTKECEADVVVMDVSMPKVGGAEATAQLREHCPDVHVVALTRHSEPGYVRNMLQAGAHGYVLKHAAAYELINAIHNVVAGSIYLDATLQERAVREFVRGCNQTGVSLDLSEREAEVARMFAYGHSNKEIATQLGLSVKTVDTYKGRAMEKLGLYSRADLVRYGIQRGWLDQT